MKWKRFNGDHGWSGGRELVRGQGTPGRGVRQGAEAQVTTIERLDGAAKTLLTATTLAAGVLTAFGVSGDRVPHLLDSGIASGLLVLAGVRSALALGHDVLVATKNVVDIAAMPRPKIIGETHGLIKVVVDRHHRPDLGRHVVLRRCPGAGQPRRARDAQWHHRHPAARRDLDPPLDHRGTQRGPGRAEAAGVAARTE